MAPQWATALAVATNVSAGTSTSSPGFTPANIRHMCKAAVPFTVTTAFFTPWRAASMASMRSTNGPMEETIPLSTHSFR
jgi:hypothetical protein